MSYGICFDCKHFKIISCTAYPKINSIPIEILNGEVDHHRPYKGDHGIQFEPMQEGQDEVKTEPEVESTEEQPIPEAEQINQEPEQTEVSDEQAIQEGKEGIEEVTETDIEKPEGEEEAVEKLDDFKVARIVYDMNGVQIYENENAVIMVKVVNKNPLKFVVNYAEKIEDTTKDDGSDQTTGLGKRMMDYEGVTFD